MVKIIFILTFFIFSLQAKGSVGACIPIGKVVILKKSIMSLDLNKKQKAKLLIYETNLKDALNDIRESANNKDEKLSTLFDSKQFLGKKFSTITNRNNTLITKAIGDYFSQMYKTLTTKQKTKLIKKFKRIERKRK